MLGQEGYKVKSAHFADNARTVVDVTWEHDTEKDVREYISATLDQDGKEVVGDKAWENLLTHIDIQSIHVNTGNYILNQKKAFEQTVLKLAKDQNMLVDTDGSTNGPYKLVADLIFKDFDADKNKEDLFVYKLQLFELEHIKNSKNRATKALLRKSTDVMTATKHAIELIEEQKAIEAEAE